MQGIQPLCRKLPYSVSAFSYRKTGAAPIATARLGNHRARNAVAHSANPGINEAVGGPMSLIQFTSQRLRINAHADWIARAPSVQEGSGPERFVQDWGALIHSCFGTRPYWEPSTAAQY